jgi:hypothetical protein
MTALLAPESTPTAGHASAGTKRRSALQISGFADSRTSLPARQATVLTP